MIQPRNPHFAESVDQVCAVVPTKIKSVRLVIDAKLWVAATIRYPLKSKRTANSARAGFQGKSQGVD